MADKRYLVFEFLVLLPPLCVSESRTVFVAKPSWCLWHISFSFFCITPRFCSPSPPLSLLLFSIVIAIYFIFDVKRDYRLMFIVDRCEWLGTIRHAHAKNTSGERTTANSLVYIGTIIMVGQCARALNERWTQQELWTKWLLWLRLGLRIYINEIRSAGREGTSNGIGSAANGSPPLMNDYLECNETTHCWHVTAMVVGVVGMDHGQSSNWYVIPLGEWALWRVQCKL